jgi:hypothetical protein
VAERPAAVVVDLTGTCFLDSSGVRCLLAAQAACRDRRIGFHCRVAANSPIVRLFRVLGVTAQLHTEVAERGVVPGSFIDHVGDALDEAVADTRPPPVIGEAQALDAPQ